MNAKITITPDEAAFDQAAARVLTDQMRAKPDSVIGLSTGRTTGALHRETVRLVKETGVDVSGITLFGLDEVSGVSRDYSGACYTMLLTEIAGPLGIGEDHFLMLPTKSPNFPAVCRSFSEELRRRGGVDLLELGLGENGHLGFNQPGSSFDSRARLSRIDPVLEARIRRETASPEGLLLGGVTLGLADIMEARRLLLVAKGAHKAEAVYRMLNGPVSEEFPASILQRHPHCEFMFDPAASSLL